jgi:hypothetical protein
MTAHLLRYFFAYQFCDTKFSYRLRYGGLAQAALWRAVSLGR